MPVEALPVPEEFRSLGDEVLTQATRLSELMGLQDWDIKFTWAPVGKSYVMETSAEPEYYKATITVDLPNLDPAHLPSYLRHELLHIILWQYTEAAEAFALKRTKTTLRKLEERMVSDLERMPLWENLSSQVA